MKRILVLALILAGIQLGAQEWRPAGEKIKTVWAEQLTPDNVWQSYPRPQLVRQDWQNLNGLWEYAVTAQDVAKKDVVFEGQILVPFAIESSLSGVQRSFLPTDRLWYRKEFTLDSDWKGRSVILHFGAVDYRCTVWVNGKEVGNHVGGNNPFSFDITPYLNKKGAQTIELTVTDPTDSESITRGKQQLNQQGIWYTPVSGIWQTVWLETVSKTHLKQILPTTDIHAGTVSLAFDICNPSGKETVEITVRDGEKMIAQTSAPAAEETCIEVPEAVLWSPSTPKLYNLEVKLLKGGKEIDSAKSYFAMREVKVGKDSYGYKRIFLNGEPVFNMGTLDQGWWPDGLLTPPSEEAMIFDMIKLKEMGFNTIRKHIKVEPEQYYYYADSLGIMLWQDMVSGFATSRKETEHVKAFAAEDWNAPAEHSEQWQGEMFEMIDRLRFYPSITTWVVFNEGWGQHNTVEIVNKVMDYDKTRIIDGVTGWTDRGVGHMHDVHNYPVSSMILTHLNKDRISVLGEFGGYGWPIEGHQWNPEMRNWGYKNINGAVELMDNYGKVIYDLETLIAQGLAAAIYTQTTDVEGEVNGLMTYDRKIVKVPTGYLHAMHDKLYKTQPMKAVDLIADGQADGSFKAEAKKGETVTLETAFDVNKKYDHLSFWALAGGHMKVWLNGTLVFDQDTRRTRQHNQYNLSDYASYLKQGSNTLKVEFKANNAQKFDFGLRALETK